MSLDAGAQAAVIAAGTAAFLVLGAGAFRCASLRGDQNRNWSRRVDLATAALDDKTITHLEQLRLEINTILPQDVFDPVDAIADPAPLVHRAEQCARTYRASRRMVSDITWLLRVGPVLEGGFIAAMLATLALTGHYGDLVGWRWLRITGYVVLIIAAVVLGVAGAAYIALQNRLSGAEILAGTGGQDGG